MLISSFLTRGSKFGKSRRLAPLTSKKGNRHNYKGHGCRKEGKNTSLGKFKVDQDKLLSIEMPDLKDFKLKAYVSPLTKRDI